MIKVKNGKVKLRGTLPAIEVELAGAIMRVVEAHVEAGIPMEEAIRLVCRCVELGLGVFPEAAGNAPESSEVGANV